MTDHEQQSETDGALLQRYCENGDEKAFQEILLRHERWVRHQCRLRLGEDHDADDATQAVFVLLARKATSIRNPQALAAWLQQATKGITANMISAAKARRSHEWAAGQEHARHRPENSDEELQAAATILPTCLDTLKPLDREVVIRHYIRCQKLTEIAKELGSTPTAIQKRTSRALTCLQTIMKRQGVVIAPALLMALTSPARAASPPERIEAIMGGINDITTLTTNSLGAGATQSWTIPTVFGSGFLGLVLVGIVIATTGAPEPAMAATIEQLKGVVVWIDEPQQAHITHLDLVGEGPLLTKNGAEITLRIQTTTITQRADTESYLKGKAVELKRGAMVISSEDPIEIRLPRLTISLKGTARVLSVEAFDRIDLIDGQASTIDVDEDITLTQGQALSRGTDCPQAPFQASPHELSPEHGGLFFREIANAYNTGQMALSQKQDLTTVFNPDLKEVAKAYPGPLLLTTAADDRGGFTISHPNTTQEPIYFALKIPNWPPTTRAKVTITFTAQNDVSGLQWNDYSDGEPLSATSWIREETPTSPARVKLPNITKNKNHHFSIESAPVGQTPDGRTIWEKMTSMNIHPPGPISHLMVGTGPTHSGVRLPPQAVLDIHGIKAEVGE